MEKINRRIIETERKSFKLKRTGFNSEGTLTLICTDECDDEILFNFRGEELKKLKEFLGRIE